MTSRGRESAMLSMCVSVSKGRSKPANAAEANVLRLAAMVIQSTFMNESTEMMKASEQYFLTHPAEKVSPVDVVRNGWIVNLPRLRDRLSQKLAMEY